MIGRPWSVDSRHASYDAAVARKAELLKDAAGLSVKIRRYRSDETFGVKVRSEKQEVPKKNKKNKQKKTSRRAKREKVE